ncbi:hypothetical protein LAZ67_3002006 [Cordylochernes scorpioides]|uniref:Uncharacterized protein n=1 Tax=Cordylochernes scorpioides TaxID=51811 RepID=A0ABY6K835_9ARAC|nr:hypothetical protein LAZ67_3002006 [Cordylochernes scorpioides]
MPEDSDFTSHHGLPIKIGHAGIWLGTGGIKSATIGHMARQQGMGRFSPSQILARCCQCFRLHLYASQSPEPLPVPSPDGGGGTVTISLKNLGSAGPADSTLKQPEEQKAEGQSPPKSKDGKVLVDPRSPTYHFNRTPIYYTTCLHMVQAMIIMVGS